MELAIGAAGAAIGWAGWGTMTAAQWGWTAAVAAYSLLGPKPEGPGPGELTSPGIQLGTQVPRPYGRVRMVVNPIWMPPNYRATGQDSGGKGGSSGPTSYTYDTDVLGIVCDGTRVVGVTREWWNKKLIYTALSDSSDESLAASKSSPHFASVTEFFGGPTQMPWSIYEDAVGAANALANRGMFTRGYAGIQCGSNKSLPLMEVEVITVGTPDPGDVALLINLPGGSVTGVPPADGSEYGLPAKVDGGGNGVVNSAGVNVSGGSQTYNDPSHIPSPVTTPTWTPDTDLTIEGQFYIDSANPQSTLYLMAACGFSFGVIDYVSPDEKSLAIRWDGYATEETKALTPVGPSLYPFPKQTWFTAGIGYTASTRTMTAYINDVAAISETGISLTATTNDEIAVRWLDVAATNLLKGASLRVTVGRNRFADPAYHVAAYPDQLTNDDLDVWIPGVEYLDDVILAELSLHPNFDPSDVDVSDIADIQVRGYVAVGPPESTVAELCDMFYVGVVPGNPIKFVKRGQASIATIPWTATGAGVGEPGESFDGLSRMGNDEVPGVKALSYPDLNRDHNTGYQRGDRLATEGPDVKRIDTRVVFTADEAKGRALSSALLERLARHTSEFGLSDYYAESEPEDVYTTTDRAANTYRQRIKGFSYADGVKMVSWELDDPNSYLLSANADLSDEPSIEVAPSAIAEWQAMDLPQLQDADNAPGYYLAVKTDDDSVTNGYESADDVTYGSVQRYEGDAVFGSITDIAGTLRAGNTFDEHATITVDVGLGELSSATRDALLSDRNLNAFAITSTDGVCRVVGQFRTATVVESGVYTLSGLLFDRWEDARFVADVAEGDVFCLLRSTGGLARIPRTVAQLGVGHFVKAVAIPRVAASVDGVAFTAAGVSLKPPAPMQLRKTLDASTGDADYTFNRCTRMETRFGGDLGDSAPLGEASEAYRITFYTDGTYAAVERTFDVTTAAFSYSAADRTTDYGSSTATAYVGIAQISATVGAGFELRTTA